MAAPKLQLINILDGGVDLIPESAPEFSTIVNERLPGSLRILEPIQPYLGGSARRNGAFPVFCWRSI
jgi:hypothetical protein